MYENPKSGEYQLELGLSEIGSCYHIGFVFILKVYCSFIINQI